MGCLLAPLKPVKLPLTFWNSRKYIHRRPYPCGLTHTPVALSSAEPIGVQIARIKPAAIRAPEVACVLCTVVFLPVKPAATLPTASETLYFTSTGGWLGRGIGETDGFFEIGGSNLSEGIGIGGLFCGMLVRAAGLQSLTFS